MTYALVSLAHNGMSRTVQITGATPAGRPARASRLPRLPHGSTAPAGSEWTLESAGSCDRSFSDVVHIGGDASIDYTGKTPAAVLRDVAVHGARWRMAAAESDGSIVATMEWCDPPPRESPPAVASAPTEGLVICRCAE